MKKRLISIITVIAIAVVAGYNILQNTEGDLSDLVLANVEAQANNYEIGVDGGKNIRQCVQLRKRLLLVGTLRFK